MSNTETLRELPISISDTLLHVKDTENTERVIMPITRYDAVLNSPKIVSTKEGLNGAPFMLFNTGEVSIKKETIKKLIPELEFGS